MGWTILGSISGCGNFQTGFGSTRLPVSLQVNRQQRGDALLLRYTPLLCAEGPLYLFVNIQQGEVVMRIICKLYYQQYCAVEFM
jgi:hypothetical protein